MKRNRIFLMAIFLMAITSLPAQAGPQQLWSITLDLFLTEPEVTNNLVVIGDNLYLLAETLGNVPYLLKLVQVNKTTGEVGWIRNLPSQGLEVVNNQLAVSPDNNLVLAHAGIVHKICPENGQDIWTHDFTNDSPALVCRLCATADYLICLDCFSHLFLVDYSDGHTIGTLFVSRGYYSVDSKGGNTIFMGQRDGLHGYDPNKSVISKIVVDTTATTWDSYQTEWRVEFPEALPRVLLDGSCSSLYVVGTDYSLPSELCSLRYLDASNGNCLWSVLLQSSTFIRGMISSDSDAEAEGIFLYGRHLANPLLLSYSASGYLNWIFSPVLPGGAVDGQYEDAIWDGDTLILIAPIAEWGSNLLADYLWLSAISTVNGVEDGASVPIVSQATCYPNPFRGSTSLKFKQAVAGPVTVGIYNMKGQLINTLVNAQPFTCGEHAINWDGKNSRGQKVTPGIYLYKITVDHFSLTGKMVLVK
ncbi:T9SS type A sorting domain-containing protein [Patescibacteria group bacterium]|nr:T9SS type A sorting domain-containing protein [Patescibacteria group bacterium]HPD07853.1 FlgD immunoglobulin-like domain containing protein [bacterium]HRT11123.1 FlgD immunoglobulin-like domain containing protein [Patescibacteria group bacterium]HRU89962.1 FlgD immunoglobulin-like domain containing protein [Patescibacteria group bacterium]